MRVVIDTNVFVSAVLGGRLQWVLDYWQVGAFTLVVSDEIVQEYLGVLRRPKFRLSADIIDPIMAQIFQQAEFFSPGSSVNEIKSDPSDNKFLEAAIEGKAIYIVSGDSHLLELGSFQGIEMINAGDFLTQLQK